MSDLQYYIIPSSLFVITLLLIVGIAWYVADMRKRRDLLAKLDDGGTSKQPPGESLSFRDKVQKEFLNLTRKLGILARPKKDDEISGLKRRFFHAGLGRTGNIVVLFYGWKVLLATILPLLLVLFRFSIFKTMLPASFIMFLVVLAVLGFYIPDLWLSQRVTKRRELILRGFPDALDLMVVCAEAGMGLDAAISRVGEETRLTCQPLSEELRFLNLELRAGKLRRDALKNLGFRTGIEDIETFVTLLIQTDRFGTSIAQALRVQADTMRTRRHQKVEELAAKLPVKLIFPTILLIFPALFLVLAGPAMIQAFRVWAGR